MLRKRLSACQDDGCCWRAPQAGTASRAARGGQDLDKLHLPRFALKDDTGTAYRSNTRDNLKLEKCSVFFIPTDFDSSLSSP